MSGRSEVRWLVAEVLDGRRIEYRRDDEAHARSSVDRWSALLPGRTFHVIRRTVTITDEVIA